MSTIYSNYEAISLVAGSYTLGTLGDGVSAATVHRIHCLTAGSVSITPMQGVTFTWTATANQFIDVVVNALTVSSGTFLGFKAKHTPRQFFGN